MAKGVAMTFKEWFNEYLNEYCDHSVIVDEDIRIGNQELKEKFGHIYDKALKRTIRDTHEAMVAFIANINSMHSRG